MRKICLLFLLSGFALFVHGQSSVLLPRFEVIGLHESYQESASNIFYGYMLKNNRYAIVFDEENRTDFSKDELNKRAKANNCKYFIKSSLNALGELIIINISMYETESQEVIWADVLKAKNIEDLDPVLQRFSKVIGSSFKASNESDIYDVSAYESNELNRYEANSNFGIFIGGAYTLMNKVDQNTSEGFGVILSYDTREYLLEAKGELFFSDINHYSFSIDMLKPLWVKKNTPFLGLGLGYGGTSVDFKEKNTYNHYADYSTYSASQGGLLLHFHTGYIFNRNANVNLRCNVSPFVGLYKVDSQNPYGIKFYVALLFD